MNLLQTVKNKLIAMNSRRDALFSEIIRAYDIETNPYAKGALRQFASDIYELDPALSGRINRYIKDKHYEGKAS